MYVLDTNTLIYFFKDMGNVKHNLLQIPPQDLAIPSIVVYELEYGLAKFNAPKKRRAQIGELCSLVNILPFNEAEAQCAATVRENLEKQGTPIGPQDVLIAGTALASQGVLVTHNTGEFSRVTGLDLEDWY
ncbi:type II toxin-antitoxin system VapC family toxin [Leucothrix sargassi]|nr:type II toxin-antitoxin system VapC family toxin [Leucothrix sargassi]